jgi:phenylalanine-4-hydroxylase
MSPVAGLVTAKSFLGQFGRSLFLSTQYMRHHSVPLYTPEPDVVHELIGHAATFADATFVALNGYMSPGGPCT